MRLDHYKKGSYSPGASLLKQIGWFYVGHLIVSSRYITPSPLKCWILRLFGAQIGRSVRIKTGVHIKFPWRLEIGDYSWIGENVWIDNLALVRIGEHCCISQGVYLCTGTHDYRKPTFDLSVRAIHIENHAWLGARTCVAPGLHIKEGAMLTMGSTATTQLERWKRYQGNPAQCIGDRPQSTSLDSAVAP